MTNTMSNTLKPWITSTDFFNFCNNDKFSDWKLYNENVCVESSCMEVYKQVSAKWANNTMKLVGANTPFPVKEMDVYECMKAGSSVINRRMICDEKEALRSIPDLLIRNDRIETLFPECSNTASQKSVFGDYYYIPISIRCSNLENGAKLRLYKTELFCSSKILFELQGVFPTYAFIIGRSTVSLVDFGIKDRAIIKVFYEGLNWLRFIKMNAKTTELHPEIYPNLKTHLSSPNAARNR